MDDHHLIYIAKLWKGTMLCNLYRLKKKCALSVEHQLVHKIFEYPFTRTSIIQRIKAMKSTCKVLKSKRKEKYLVTKTQVECGKWVLTIIECWHSTYSSLLFIGWGDSQVQFFFFCNEPIGLAHHSRKKETMRTPQNRKFYFEI